MKLKKQNFNLVLSVVVFFVIGSKLVFGLENIPQLKSESPAPEHKVTISPELEAALLAEDWQTVARECDKYDPNALVSSPVLRAIKGHTCLALNRNDESLTMFLSINNEPDRTQWRQWTADFAKTNPDNPVALYLKGDALARGGNWQEATENYSTALGGKRDFVLALNARGVAYACQKDYNKARDDFEAAIVKDPNFADAYASLGTLKVLKEAPEGAIADYNEAISKSSAFALAYNGRACARIGYSTDPNNIKKAIQDYISATSCVTVSALVQKNMKAISSAIDKATGYDVNASEGMTLTASQFRDMDSQTRMQLLNGMPKDQLLNLANNAHENYAHSKAWGEAVQYLGINASGLPLTNADQSLRHANEHLGVFNDAQTILQDKYGISMFKPGGARTQELQTGYADRGNWPVKTWFGLVQQVQSPKKLVEGKAAKE